MEATRLRPPAPGPGQATATPGSKPVRVWAVVGAGFLTLWAYLWVRWIAAGDLGPIPSGPTPIPQPERMAAHSMEVAMILALVAIGFLLVVRPWRREHRLSLDGLLFFGMLTLYWQDMMPNYVRPYFLFNLGFFHTRSWAEFIPGIRLPNAHLFPEPIIFEWSGYGVAFLGGCLLGSAVMRKAKERWPTLGALGLAGICFGVLVVLDLAMELFWLRMRLYSYPATWGPTLLKGRTYQLPVFQVVVWSVCWTVFAALRYFRNDLGETVAERGASQLRVGRRARTGVRFLALVGALNVIYLGYNAATIYYGLHSGGWPNEVLDRSYLKDGLCGPGSGYACPSRPLQILPPEANRRPAG